VVEINKLTELPHFIFDGYFPQTNIVYEFFGCFWYGHNRLQFLDIIATNGDNLAARYEKRNLRLEQVTRPGFQVIVQCKYEFEDETPELFAHTAGWQSILCTR